MNAIELIKVSKSYNGKEVIKDISFSVELGEIFGLLGPNGAGKTTILRMMLDIIKPDSGGIKVFGSAITSIAKNRIGYLPEERGLYKRSRVLDMLVYLATLKDIPPKEAEENAIKLLKSVEMYEYKNKKIEELSKGMQQKIQFLATIVHNPELIIIDEPFSGLDPVNTKLIKNILLKLKNSGKTIILSTHQMEQAEKICDRVLMINNGSVVLYGSLEDIKKKYGKNSIILEFEGDPHTLEEIEGISKIEYHNENHNKYVELYLEDNTSMQTVLQKLVLRVEVTKFEPSSPRLEDIFIEIVEGQKYE